MQYKPRWSKAVRPLRLLAPLADERARGRGLLGLAWAAMHSSLQTLATEVLPGARATVVSMFAALLLVGSAVAAVLVAGLADRAHTTWCTLATPCLRCR